MYTLCRFSLLIFCFIIGTTACNKDEDDPSTSELLVGVWTTTNVTISGMVGSQSITDYLVNDIGLTPVEANTFFAGIAAMLEPEVTGVLTLKADNTYVSNFAGGMDSGTWELSADEKTLILYEGADVINAAINSISSTTMVATLTDTFAFDLDNMPGTPDEDVLIEARITYSKS